MITSEEVRNIFPRKTEKLLFAKSWTLPTDEQMKEALELHIDKRQYSRFVDTQTVHNKIDCARNVMCMVTAFCIYDWAVGLAQIDGHALFFYINDRKEIVLIESLDGSVVDQKVKINLIIMI